MNTVYPNNRLMTEIRWNKTRQDEMRWRGWDFVRRIRQDEKKSKNGKGEKEFLR